MTSSPPIVATAQRSSVSIVVLTWNGCSDTLQYKSKLL